MSSIIDGYCTPGTERETPLAPDDLLRQMDEAGIAQAVIAPEDREIVIDNDDGNRRILALATQHPGRFLPACSINPWRRDACDALGQTVRDGAKMLVLAPALQGFIPTDELTDDLLDAAGVLKLPVYVHTGPHAHGGPTQVVLLAERHPRTPFIVGHCGTTDHAWDMPTIFRRHMAANLWFELSFVRPWGAATLPTDKLIFGTSAPRNDPVFELKQLDQYLPIAEHADVYGGNLARLIAEVRHAG